LTTAAAGAAGAGAAAGAAAGAGASSFLPQATSRVAAANTVNVLFTLNCIKTPKFRSKKDNVNRIIQHPTR
jgi:hypothetical protein